MKRSVMAETAELADFDDQLYKANTLEASGEDQGTTLETGGEI
jgi:hypothetical protein